MFKVKSKSEIFTEAWQIAKAAAARWGGKARSYLSAALRQVYAELRKIRQVAPKAVRKEQAVAVVTTATETAIVARAAATIVAARDAVVASVSAAGHKVSNLFTKGFGFIAKAFDFTPRMEVALE